MKKLLSIFALIAFCGYALHAQDATGTWQGTLQAGGKELRIVMKISNDGGLSATMYSIDQGGQSIPGSVTLQGSAVKITVPGIAGIYEGRLTADAISGTWSQGGGPALPLNLKRATAETAWAIPAKPAALAPMTSASPAFEVATIKPSRPEAQGKIITIKGRQVITINTTMSDLATFAYGLHARQITAAPPWIESDRYDLTGQPDAPGQPNVEQLKIMMQKLLADRFKLAFHRDKKELSCYAIVTGKTAHKLTKNDNDPNGLPGLFFRQLGALTVRNATMSDFAGVMQATVLDRPVIDQSELAGRYDFTLTWTPDETQFGGLGARVPPPPDSATAPPGLFTAIQEQLGLRLASTKAPVEVLVVDRVEKPTEN